MIRVALVGTGSMGSTHAAAYRTMPDVTVTGVVGRNPTTTAALASALGASPYTDLERVLREQEPDVVDCCLPTPLHRSTVERAGAHGCHVICEKPLALSVEDGRAMIRACRDAGVHLLIGQVVRFFPEFRSLAEVLRAGRVGTLVTLTSLRQGFYPTGRDGWYRDDARSGGVFLDLMIHDLDWALQQCGPAERVYARLARRGGAQPFAQGMATIRHRSGVISQVTGTWGHPGSFTTMAELAGTGGLLRHHSAEAQPLHLLTAIKAVEAGDVALPDLSAGEDPYRTELAHFINVIAGNVESIVRPEESLSALALALAARSSAENGRSLAVEEVAV